MASGYIHLHLHSSYSMLDGMMPVSAIVKAAKRFGMPAVALTDHGNMYGIVEFFKAAKANDIKPILGVEAYLALNGRHDRSSRNHHRHVVLLAKNKTGYQNLVELISVANMEGFYYKPCIDHEVLEQHSDGLVCMSACLSGEIPRYILENRMTEARQATQWYRRVFGEDFYLEIQRNGLKDQEIVNRGIIELAREFGIGMVATTDSHYLNRADAEVQEIAIAIGSRKTLDDENRFKIETTDIYFKSPEEMAKDFEDMPEVIATSLEIAGKIEEYDITRKKHILPRFPTPDDETEDEYLRRLSYEGLDARLKQHPTGIPYEEYEKRLEYELGTIIQMGFPGYFLIVADFIVWAKSKGIMVGPGRGSGAGSLVAYCLKITELDPLRYSLLFERFLNPERVSMPDFDVDFCKNRRDEVIAYVTRAYGQHNVGQIATFQTIKAKAAVRDVSRVLGHPPAFANDIAKLIPDRIDISKDEKKAGVSQIQKVLQIEPKLKVMYDNDPQIHRVIDLADKLSGTIRQAGKHPGGTIIAPEPLYKLAPVTMDTEKNMLVVQYGKDVIDDVGLVKFDFLGLKTLTIIQTALEFINERRKTEGLEPVTTETINTFDDPEVYALYSRGDTDNVFQSESEGFKRMLRDLKPDSLEDMIAAVSLYRPGPMEFIPTVVRRKHGLEKIEYDMPELEPILKETYGVIVYQEQVMRIASAVAGYSLGGADILRRAMGKKKVEEMDRQRAIFRTGAVENGHTAEDADALFDKVQKFAGYGFNKSHAAVYASVSYQTAWLKVHYPVEFMASVMTIDSENIDKLLHDVQAVRDMGLSILPPDINRSFVGFTVDNGAIRFGLGAVRGVGRGAIEAIIEAREQHGAFTDLYDFCRKVNTGKVNKGVLESLIKAGAFDVDSHSRGACVAAMEGALQEGSASSRQSGMMSLFDVAADNGHDITPDPVYPDVHWTERERLAMEREALGFYLSGHPMDAYKDILPRVVSHTMKQINMMRESGTSVVIAGVLEGVSDRPLKSGRGRYARGSVDTPDGRVNFIMFSKVYEQYHEYLTAQAEPLVVSGSLEVSERTSMDEGEGGGDAGDEAALERTIRVDSMEPLSTIREATSRRLIISLSRDIITRGISRIQDTLRSYSGGCDVFMRLPDVHPEAEVTVKLPAYYRVSADMEMMEQLRRVVGRENVWTE